jgi:hypothetical protein
MLHIPVSAFSRVGQWLFDRLTKSLMLPTYAWSHERWETHHRLGSRWKALGHHAEYSVRLAILADPNPRVSRIAIRARNQGLRKLDLVFESTGGGIRYQDRISIDNVDRRPVVCNLLQAPCCDVIRTSGDDFYFSVESYRIINCRAELADGQTIDVPDCPEAHLTQTWLLQSTWKRRWGKTWNCDATGWAKRGISEYWRFGFAHPRVVVYPASARPGRRSRRPIWRTMAMLAGKAMGCSWLVTCQFWLAIWSGLFVLDDNERLRWRWKKVTENMSAG